MSLCEVTDIIFFLLANWFCAHVNSRVETQPGSLTLKIKHCLVLLFPWQDVGLWLEEINLGGYRQVFRENGVNGEYLEGMSMFTTEQILRFIRRCHMKWGDFITLCKELRRIKGLSLSAFINLHECPLLVRYSPCIIWGN